MYASNLMLRLCAYNLIWFPLVGMVLGTATDATAAPVELRKGDHICLVGNALGEGMQFAPDWEALLYARFPDHELVVRNLCFPGDEPFHRERSLNFGTPDDHLKHSQADVIWYFFGLNESFAGRAGLKKFRDDLDRLVQETKSKDYSGRGAPRIVLVSPIAHENLKNPNVGDGVDHNRDLQAYTEAMREVAGKQDVGFVDLFTPTQAAFAAAEQPWTMNGVHLTERGYQQLSPLFLQGLLGEQVQPSAQHAQLVAAIADKNFHWWHRYRAVNGYSIWGTRGLAGSDGTYTNRDVMERERAILDEMCANRDQRIWQLARGVAVPAQVDDSNTLPFIFPKTNVGGADDPNRKSGKLGSLDYLSAAEQLKHFKVAPGYEIQLVASEEDFPELANPVAMNFDSRGRLWVATMPSYPQWQPKSPMDDKLLILEDTNGDGRSDTCKVFAGGLHQPTGFELGNGGAYVAMQPDVLFLKDEDGDDQADVRVRRLFGFDTADSHHGLAAFEWGPDGALYFQEGTFKQSQVESPYGVSRLADAGVWRYEPRTEEFGVYVSLAFANPWGHVFDAWGQNFLADASPGENYWAAPISGFVPFPDKHAGGSRAKNLDWGGSKSDRDYPPFFPKRIRPSSGCEIVSSRHFPEEAQGNYLVNNVIGDLGVLQHTRFEQGSGFGAKEVTPLLLSDHGNFRPVDLQFGPDGALYIVDWHNALIGHLQHNLREPYRDHSHGRIWRVVYKDRPLLQPKRLDNLSVPDLVNLLREPEDRTRYRVRRELAARPTDEVVAALEAWLANIPAEAVDAPANQLGPEHDRLEALWIYQTHNVVQPELLERMLESPDHRARAAATRVLCEWRDRIPNVMELLAARIHDKHPRPRLEAVRALSFIHQPQSLELALDVLQHEKDEFLDYTLDETIRVLSDILARKSDAQALAYDAQKHERGVQQPGGHDHAHSGPAGATAPAPVIFLDKPPAIVAYQLARLSPGQLLAVTRSAEEPRFQPVYEAILVAPGISRQDRQEALTALVSLTKQSPVQVLLTALRDRRVADEQGATAKRGSKRGAENAKIRASSAVLAEDSLIRQLASLLLNQSPQMLAQQQESFRAGLQDARTELRAVSYAAFVAAGAGDEAWKIAAATPQGRADFLLGATLLPHKEQRIPLRDEALQGLAAEQPLEVRLAALRALAAIPAQQGETFHRLVPLLTQPPLRPAAVATMLSVPADQRAVPDARQAARQLVQLAENTPAAQRTSDDFLDALQLTDEMLALLPTPEARELRARLREVTVRVVRINTVHEEMRYDTPYFAVEAGRPVQLVLRNEDLMPHNLVVTVPGKMRDVAMQAATMPPQPDKQGYLYVPKSSDVLFATRMVDPHRQDVLTFTAPTEPGEYPYVCTFPNHWMRMYGVMVVVPDLDSWLAKPQKPTDPLGLTREFVRNWTVEDLQSDLDTLVRGRSTEIGLRVFREATCLQCHKLSGEGGAVGPDLTETFQRQKQDRVALLREILDPSHKVDPKYALFNVFTSSGRVISGIVTEQNAETITVISNPEKPHPEVLARDDIDELVKSSASLMPKGLLDRYTRDEIGELLALLMAPPAGAAKPEHKHGH